MKETKRREGAARRGTLRLRLIDREKSPSWVVEVKNIEGRCLDFSGGLLVAIRSARGTRRTTGNWP